MTHTHTQVNYLIACSQLLVEAKRRELKYRAQQRAKEAKADGAGAKAGAGAGESKKSK